jgi:hypothetical protein
MFRGIQGWFLAHGSNSIDAAEKSMGALYGMVQQQAALLSFVEAFWIMGVVFVTMLPLVLLMRDARTLHSPRPAASAGKAEVSQPSIEEPELLGAFH